jgi:3-methyladenine DNA glycosylase AlkD
MQNLKCVNNWNLVDTSAHLIIGAHLWDKDRSSLLNLATSEILWERRISIVSTWYFIRKNDLAWTYHIASLLLRDTHDLIHKAAGWMLREAGKRDQPQLVIFLDQHMHAMPRTMLRYAIEKFPDALRKSYL